MNLESVNNIYFVGIGGIGMSALATYFYSQGNIIAGYDKTPSSITDSLQEKGITVQFNDSIREISDQFLDKTKTIIIYTPAISETNQLFAYFTKNDYLIFKRAEILGKITNETTCLAVAGTHGKTTTTSILGHIMNEVKATSFLGGISENYNSNLILGDNKISVVEADEFDRSFLTLKPNIACITSMDADHLDIYDNPESLKKAFYKFSELVLDTLIVAKGLPIKGLTYAIEEPADYCAKNIRIEKGSYIFDVVTPKSTIENIQFSLPGRHNIMNALAALAMADSYGINLKTIKERLSSFKGVRRRFSYKIKSKDFILIDDYAHHPTEIRAVENALRELHPDKEIMVIFQPHLFSRTRDFMDDFAKVLSSFNHVILLDIYPAREKPIPTINSSELLHRISISKKQLVAKENVVECIRESKAHVVAMLGAGDIGVLIESVTEELLKNKKYAD